MPRILIAFDGSDASRRALGRVTRFMKEADVGLVTVARPIYRDAPHSGYADPTNEDQQRELLCSARDELRRARVRAGRRSCRRDLKTAKVFEPELIVIGARSLGTIGRLVLGSVSTKVMHESDCGVLIVK